MEDHRTQPDGVCGSPKGSAPKAEFLEADEYERLLNRVRDTRYYGMITFLAASGVRRGEALALRWSDVDLRTDTVVISKSLSETRGGLELKTPKSGKMRRVRISGVTMQVLLKHRDQIEEEKRFFGPGYNDQNLVFRRQPAISTCRRRSRTGSASS